MNNLYPIKNTPSMDKIWQESHFSLNGSMDDHDIYRAGVVVNQSASPTKLEPQYLLANTLFATGTTLQGFLTKWDSADWDDGASGTTTFYSQAEAANASTSDVTIDQADGGGIVTNSTLTDIDNAQISVAMTMPASENLDTKATTNGGDISASRILVAYVFSAGAAATLAFDNQDLIITS